MSPATARGGAVGGTRVLGKHNHSRAGANLESGLIGNGQRGFDAVAGRRSSIGSTNFGYQWQFNGVSIARATNSSYTVTNASPANAGSYTVIVSNVVATVTSAPPATLTIQSAPAITAQPTNQKVFLGQKAALAVTVVGVNSKANPLSISGTRAITIITPPCPRRPIPPLPSRRRNTPTTAATSSPLPTLTARPTARWPCSRSWTPTCQRWLSARRPRTSPPTPARSQ